MKITAKLIVILMMMCFIAVCADAGDPKGKAWGDTRFTDNSDGTVTDNLTNLIWLKNANSFGAKNWSTAKTDCKTLASGAGGLTDGSSAGDWRLPTVKELQSLIDFSQYNPALPPGHLFTNVQPGYYWSGVTCADSADNAWYVTMSNGGVYYYYKAYTGFVWPVRGGKN